MTRRLPEKEQQSAEKGLRYSFIGAGFLLIAIIMLFAAPAPTSWALCFAMLVAAFPLLGSGIAKILYVRRYEQAALRSGAGETPKLIGQSVGQLPPRNTSEIVQPPSITEGTTKILPARPDNQN